MADWMQDLRSVLRNWRHAPGLSLTVLGTLTLSLGLASAIFAFADGYLFRPLPFPGADRLFYVRDPNEPIVGALMATDQAVLRASALAPMGFVDFTNGEGRVNGRIELEGRQFQVTSYEISLGFQDIVRLPLVAGRAFTAADHSPGDQVPILLSHRFWLKAFGGDRAVVGRSFRVLGRFDKATTMTVIGILGPAVTTFDLNNQPPDAIAPATSTIVCTHCLAFPIVRVADGQTPEQAADLIASVLQAQAPAKDGKPRTVRLQSFQQSQVSGGRPTARVLLAGALLVLLLTAINLVHVLLARGAARTDEVMTRMALGASRWRVTRLFLTEAVVLAAVGIAGGLLVGSWLASIIESSIPGYPTRGRNMSLVAMQFDWRTVVFASSLGLLMSLIGGLWPARRVLRQRMIAGARRHGIVETVPARVSRSILASQFAVATVLLLGAAFIGMGIWRYLHQPLGFEFRDRFTVSVSYSEARERVPASEVDAFYRTLRTIPGVRSAGPNSLPGVDGIAVPGRTLDPRSIRANGVWSGYFESWNLVLLGGRWFTPQELVGLEPVAVVDSRFAEVAWPGENPVGKDVDVGKVMRRVVGVTQQIRFSLSRPMPGQVFVPAVPNAAYDSNAVVVAPGVSLADLRTRIIDAVRQSHPAAWVRVSPITMDSWFSREIGEARFQTPIVIGFGALTFLLAGVGVFGLVSYLVERRRREFGIRLALGARPGDIWRSVIRQSLSPALIGLAIGGVGAAVLEKIVRASVFGWDASGSAALIAVAAVLIAIAILAAAVPARRAMRTDPAVTLRTE